MSSDFIRRIKNEITRAEGASGEILAQIEEELDRAPSAELWILLGDAIQLSDDDEVDLDDVEASYLAALELDPNSADAWESLGHFAFGVADDARAAAEYFRAAIKHGAGAGAREGLAEAEDELAELG